MLNQLMLPQAGEYVTFKQAMDEGHPVKKGEKSSMVFFFKFFETVDEDTGEEKTIPLLKLSDIRRKAYELPLEEKAAALVARANDEGGKDNISVILINTSRL